MQLSPYTFLGVTQSLCPECLAVVPAKIVSRRGRVYFRKRCPTHGVREDYVCSDVTHYDRLEYTTPSKLPVQRSTAPDRGCPYDCGLCDEHEQHTCIGLVELTSSCNLRCPMCYASSGPGGKHLSFDECKRAIDRLVEVEGRAEVLQLSGGEPTLHPQFEEILEYAVAQPIDYVMINTNGVRFAHDPALADLAGGLRDRVEVYFQLDGVSDDVLIPLRGEPLWEIKQKALENLGRAGVNVTLVATMQGGVNDDQMGPLVRFALERPWIVSISFQPATYSGRHALPETLENRITFPDVIRGLVRQTDGMFREDDFLPLPCAHPNCHQVMYAYRNGASVTPLTRFIDAKQNLDLLANGVTFTRARSRDLIQQYLGRQSCCGGSCGPEPTTSSLPVIDSPSSIPHSAFRIRHSPDSSAADFFTKILSQQLGARDVFRISVTSFLDAYNFDVRRLMKCCTHHILPSGHVIPFCAYNTLYREGHIPLPPLT
ncbi:MAG: radical SAM protein [Planctomycetes bacterium]|nr:radical SAM protein [Planctomycetota bacterium]